MKIAGGLIVPAKDDLVSGPVFRSISSGFLKEGDVVVKINDLQHYNTRKGSVDLMFDSESDLMSLTVFIPKDGREELPGD